MADRRRSLEDELSSPEMLATIADEQERSRPENRIKELHGDDWMAEEQADWEAGE